MHRGPPRTSRVVLCIHELLLRRSRRPIRASVPAGAAGASSELRQARQVGHEHVRRQLDHRIGRVQARRQAWPQRAEVDALGRRHEARQRQPGAPWPPSRAMRAGPQRDVELPAESQPPVGERLGARPHPRECAAACHAPRQRAEDLPVVACVARASRTPAPTTSRCRAPRACGRRGRSARAPAGMLVGGRIRCACRVVSLR